ncbi:hypothetical protein CCACVL1_17576 [Corchorus capsularis]|uniref:Auxin response factor n=1 Tax=Corchorus capsularis TaxID=210143 RepID=A0A1R3HQZ5_COCAP|nr:hypothetical protein CCACVL1_17576 [Corchorus capsularis]
MPLPRPPPPTELRHVDSRIWRACAGNSVQIPTVHSRVYYFPQGHVEQSCGSTSLLSPLVLSRPLVPCVISEVHCLADPKTDEVFAKLLLFPVEPSRLPNQFLNINGEDDDSDKIVSFAKILTPSDANNGGGFSVPRFCADSIFPPLDYNAEPPVQNLDVTDVQGGVWEFRHIYRGTPRRHLLTTGWSKFVNNKKLIAGDSVVFMRDSRGKMFIGVRRATKRGEVGGDSGRWREANNGGAMRWEGRGRMTAEAVAEAAERAVKGLPFEVVYYPRAGWADFVVRAELVEAAVNTFWAGGTRVKMAMETEDSSRMTWFQGTIMSAAVPDSGPWVGSPWRMLQVAWDEPEVLQNAKRVSPWQVEIVSSSPLHPSIPSAKKFKYSQDSGLTDPEGEIFFPMTGFTNSTLGYMNPSLLNYNSFPAGMQGARQNHFHLQSLTNSVSENSPMIYTDSISGNFMVPNLKRISTELNIGSSASDNLSPDSQSSILSYGTELTENGGSNSSKAGGSSIQLFGQIIHQTEPVGSRFDDVGHDLGKRYEEGADVTGYSKLLDRLDVQCQRASAVEGFSL